MSCSAQYLLEEADASIPRSDAMLLLSHFLGIRRETIIAHPDHPVSDAEAGAFRRAVSQAKDGYPIPYLTGKQSFWQWDFTVTPDTLIPRSDTETLIETVLDLFPADRPLRVLDLGTGPGTIAITLALLRPIWQVSASDCSTAALAVARRNASDLQAQVTFYESDWFASIPNAPYDLIVSNPPYIREGDSHLYALRFEPALALTSGVDGLTAIRTIATKAPHFLVDRGALVLEMGYDQGEAVRTILSEASFTSVRTVQDLGHRDRVTLGFKA